MSDGDRDGFNVASRRGLVRSGPYNSKKRAKIHQAFKGPRSGRQMEIVKGSARFCYAVQESAQLEGIFTTLEARPPFLGLALVGRSNVGKSSLINALFGKCVARTSKTPGRTRCINIFELALCHNSAPLSTPLWLFDLPGYGFARIGQSMRQNWDTLMGHFFELAPPTLLLINLQDARHPNAKADLEFHRFLRPLALPFFLVFNKADKLKTQRQRASLERQKPQLLRDYPNARQVHFVSATQAQNFPQRQQLADALAQYFGQLLPC